MSETSFWCGAYGPPPAADGSVWSHDADWPRRFVSSDPALRRCESRAACDEAMASERSRVFARINELAVDGGPHAETFRYLAAEIPTPDSMLGGGDAGAQENDR